MGLFLILDQNVLLSCFLVRDANDIPENLHILNHTSNAKSNRTFNITYIVSSIVKQFYQNFKTLIYENESRTSSVNHPLLIITCLGECLL